jgi:hypothetical protein
MRLLMRATKNLLLAATVFCGGFNLFAQTWTQTGATNASWTSIASSADGTKLVAVASGAPGDSTIPLGIYVSTNSGMTWMIATNVSAPWAAAISADGSRMVVAITTGGNSSSVLLSTNFGATWAPVYSASSEAGNVASSADGHALLVGGVLSSGTGGFAFVSTNFGSSWSQINLSQSGSYVATSADGVKMFATGNGYPNAGNTAFFFISTNGGGTWKRDLSAPVAIWSSVACATDGVKIVASVYQGVIYTSTNSGVSWMTNNVPATNWWYVASSSDGTHLTAAFGNSTKGSGIYTTTNSGATWALNSPTNEYWFTAAMSADGNKWFVGARENPNNLTRGQIYSASLPAQTAMNIAMNNGSLALSWLVPSTNFVLQQNSDLTTTNWSVVTNQPILNLTNLQNQVTLPLPANNAFFRLKTP